MNSDWVAYHIAEAKAELERVLKELASSEYSDEAFRVHIEHAFHHLNTAWNSRNESNTRTEACSEEDFDKWRAFPQDLVF